MADQLGKGYFRFRPGESRRQGAVWRRYIFAHFMLRGHVGPSFLSVRIGDARRCLRKTPPVGFEPWTFRSEVLTSSAAANPPPKIPRQSVPLKDRLFSPPLVLLRLLVCRCFRYPLSAFGVGFAVVSFFFACWFVGGFVNFLRA